MGTFDRRNGFDGADAFGDDEITRQAPATAPFAVHSCSRVGMQANPPVGSLGGWFRRH